MVAAQRYPLEVDGVIVGSPAMRTNDAAIGANWVNVQLNAVAPRGTNGQPVTKDALSSTQKQAAIDGIRNACDANDGVRDGRIFNPSAVHVPMTADSCTRRFRSTPASWTHRASGGY